MSREGYGAIPLWAVFPALAGMSRPTPASRPPSQCFPRVSGDEPSGVATLWEYMQFSLRERG